VFSTPKEAEKKRSSIVGSGKVFGRLIALLVLSALLEVGGDAGIRSGLQGKQAGFVLGSVLLIAYGFVVNLSKLDFGKLMGLYIAIFFIVSQVIALLVFKEKLNPPTLVGGALIVAGGCVLTFWRTTG
jgi:small multidrug resistance family-3 protein